MSLPLPPADHVDLLPLDDPQWGWDAFERFCLAYVNAQPDVADAHKYGTRGQGQLGIDIAAKLTSGRTRAPTSAASGRNTPKPMQPARSRRPSMRPTST
jgi:hypothetical protein